MLKKSLFGILVLSSILAAFLLPGCALPPNPLDGGPDPGGQSVDPITIPDSVDPDLAYTTLENDFFDAINVKRTDAAVAAFTARDTALDGLARRYARVGTIDTDPGNLQERIESVGITNNQAASFGFGSPNIPVVASVIATWISQAQALANMTSSSFTKIGIGITTGPAAEGAPGGGTWIHVCILMVKP